MDGQCFPNVYKYTYTVADLAGNVATQRITVAVVTQGALDLVTVITVGTQEAAEDLAEQVGLLRGRTTLVVVMRSAARTNACSPRDSPA
jgi:hypothetical protein